MILRCKQSCACKELPCSQVQQRGLFRDEHGMTTVGIVISLLLALSLIFTSGQVMRVQAASSEVQAVADAAALAAENEVAEFMIVARVCDAVVLSLSLTSLAATGLGVVALCVPGGASVGDTLLAQGRQVAQARNSFADKAASGLNKLQALLPYFAAANAAQVAASNNVGQSNYIALAMLTPFNGEEIQIDAADAAEEIANEADEKAQELKEKALQADEAAERANEAKERGYNHDCGYAPGYCMKERAESLANLTGSSNPSFHSVETWSFSAALERAKAYYPVRLQMERPSNDSVEEQARSALRKQFYRYAVEKLSEGYVIQTDDYFEANFPLMPRNTNELRSTSLYTDAVYPRTEQDDKFTLHAWDGCPNAQDVVGNGCAKDCESDKFEECSECQFDEHSLGSVAQASTSIENGFEHHYRAVAEAAKDYEVAYNELGPARDAVKDTASTLIDKVKEALRAVAGKRIEASPPGRYGVVVLAANIGKSAANTGFKSRFVKNAGSLEARAAVSAATLLTDESGEGETVINNLLNGYREQGGAAIGAAGIVLDCWSGLLTVYAKGQQAIGDTVENALDGLPLVGASGLGSWAKRLFNDAVADCGLEPAKLDALKPVLVNSAHVAAADDSAFSARLLSVKKEAIAHPLQSNEMFGSIISSIEQSVLEAVNPTDGTVVIAQIEILGEGGPSIPIEVSVPAMVSGPLSQVISSAAEYLRCFMSWVTKVRVWE